MNRILILLGGVLLGAFLGAVVNMGLILLGSKLLPPPPGVDVNDVNSINAHIGEYTPLQLLTPFLAHALGTLVGAFIAARVNAPHGRGLQAAFAIGGIFLGGGIGAVRMIPDAPLWFDVLDLTVAYVPMALLGWKLAVRR